jgi:hypothetical protein
MAHDVRLAAPQTPRFPPRCVVREREQPGTTAEVTVLIAAPTRSLGANAIDLLAGSTPTVTGNRTVTFTIPPALVAKEACGTGTAESEHLWLVYPSANGQPPLLNTRREFC